MERVNSKDNENSNFHPTAYEVLKNGLYKENYAEINGISIYYEYSGDTPEIFDNDAIYSHPGCKSIKEGNKPAVLIVHGWTANRYRLHPLYMFLGANGFPTFRMDLRGHGWSQKDEDLDYSLDTFVKDIYEFMEKIIVEKYGFKSVVLVGHSMGGLLVQGVMCKYRPKFVEKMILLSTSPYFFDNIVRKLASVLEERAYIKDFDKKYRKKYDSEEKMGLEFFPQWKEELSLDVPSFIPAKNATISTVREMRVYNLKDCIKKADISIPVLIVTGSKDILAPKRFSEWMEKNYRNAKAFLIENGEHNIDIDKPYTLHRIIGDFLCGKSRR